MLCVTRGINPRVCDGTPGGKEQTRGNSEEGTGDNEEEEMRYRDWPEGDYSGVATIME